MAAESLPLTQDRHSVQILTTYFTNLPMAAESAMAKQEALVAAAEARSSARPLTVAAEAPAKSAPMTGLEKA
eukprot:scaffold57735_cov54-Phaeocystis_antarctica.AAC.2